jgi:hypothetical protein
MPGGRGNIDLDVNPEEKGKSLKISKALYGFKLMNY